MQLMLGDHCIGLEDTPLITTLFISLTGTVPTTAFAAAAASTTSALTAVTTATITTPASSAHAAHAALHAARGAQPSASTRRAVRGDHAGRTRDKRGVVRRRDGAGGYRRASRPGVPLGDQGVHPRGGGQARRPGAVAGARGPPPRSTPLLDAPPVKTVDHVPLGLPSPRNNI